MIETHAPGKLFIAGEYAVVDAGEPAVLVAVDRGIIARLDPDAHDQSEAPSPHVREAIRAVDQLREHRGLAARPFTLTLTSDLEDENGRKFGLGSSAAVTVAVVDALAQHYALGLSLTDRFRLALLATLEVSPKASGGDLAASTFRGWISYTSPDREELRSIRRQHGIAHALDHEAWQECTIAHLPPPTQHRLMVGWTGTPASTERLVDSVQRGAAEVARDRAAFLAGSREVVARIIACLSADEPGLGDAISDARGLLRELATRSGIEIETDTLRTLCDIAEHHGAFAKTSGAGGGDCGIVLAGREVDTERISREWHAHGIRDLALHVSPAEGVVDER